MARIDKSDMEYDSSNHRLQTQVKATYGSFIEGGKRYFQLDTYGTSSRKVKDTPSQKIQFDEETAKHFIEIIKKEFHI